MIMKYKKFEVVELKDNNRATILKIEENEYFAEIVNSYGITVDKKLISDNEINKVIHSRNGVAER